MTYFYFFPSRAGFLLLLVLLLALTHSGWAQNWSGLAHSNYGGTQNIYLNPASLADSRHAAYLNLGSGNATFYNTYLQLELPSSPLKFLRSGQELRERYLQEQGGGGPYFATFTGEARLPSLMLAVGKQQGIAFTNRVRVFAQANNVSENLARVARYGLDDANSLGLSNDNNFTLSAGAYHEFAFSYARTFTANQTHFWKGGITAKYLVGLAGGYLQSEGTGYQVYDEDSVQLRNANLNYGFTNPELYDQQDFSVGSLYGKQRLGRGVGFDVGVAYEWRPDHDQYEYQMDGRTWEDATRNKYRLRLGLALTDIGAIRYNNAQYVRQARVANSQTLQLGQLDTIQIRNADDIAPTLDRLVGLSEQSQRFTTYLPTTLRLSADYRLANHVYAGLQWTQSLLPERTIGQRSISSLVLTPRLEFSHVEVAVPVLLTNRYRSLQLGAMVRLGPLLIGSDNLGGLLGLTATTGADVYVGLGLALHKKRLKDRDKDGVSNKLDKCPKVKGTWALQGCPDQDGDGIADAADACPTEAGPSENKGCPLPATEQSAPVVPAPTPEPTTPTQPEQTVAPTPPTTPTPPATPTPEQPLPIPITAPTPPTDLP